MTSHLYKQQTPTRAYNARRKRLLPFLTDIGILKGKLTSF